jgi:hypothetical protein
VAQVPLKEPPKLLILRAPDFGARKASSDCRPRPFMLVCAPWRMATLAQGYLNKRMSVASVFCGAEALVRGRPPGRPAGSCKGLILSRKRRVQGRADQGVCPTILSRIALI